MAEYEELRNGPTVSIWLERISTRPKTERARLQSLDKYIKFTGMSLAQLLEEAKREQREGVDMNDRAVLNRR